MTFSLPSPTWLPKVPIIFFQFCITNVLFFVFLLLFFCRKMTEEMLRRAREDQVKNKEHFLAVQAARDRAEFERVLK